ncbi:MAG: NAD-dependent epimerase/dehydratase family protein [Planctomycetaceae bacterium]|nr:NAD-dependent epimerase/dehydratase family protein [Planctomycetaceae bacterium]
MKVLVTGGTGFVGRRVCRDLLECGHDVVATSRGEHRNLTPHPHLQVAEIRPVETFTGWKSLLTDVDAVVHLIARTHVTPDAGTDSLADWRSVNVVGTENLLQACLHASVRRFVYLSSIKAVGEGRPSPYVETDECRPEDSYGISKREAEQAVFRLTSGSGIEPVVLRPPLVYGSGAKGNLNRLMNAAHRGRPIPVGSRPNARSLIHVDDLAGAVQFVLSQPEAAGKILHVADPHPVSTRTLVESIARAMQCQSRVVVVPDWLFRFGGAIIRRQSEVRRLLGSLIVSPAAIQDMGWRTQVTFEDGIQEMVSGFTDSNR